VSNLLRRGAFILTAVFSALLVLFTVGQLVEDLGRWWGTAAAVVLLLSAVTVSYLAAVRPRTTSRLLAMGVGVLAVYVVAESLLPGDPALSAVPVGTAVLAVPLTVLGLRRTREAGALLLLDGMLPVLSLLVLTATSIERTGVSHSSSSEFVGIPVFVGGVLFLLAWVVRPRRR
jgi:hypothetical protein